MESGYRLEDRPSTNGKAGFEITTWISEPIRKRWRDGKRKKLESSLVSWLQA